MLECDFALQNLGLASNDKDDQRDYFYARSYIYIEYV